MFIHEVMVRDPITIDADRSLFEAGQLMKMNHIGRLIVVNETKSVIGMLTDGDLVHEPDLNKRVKDVMTSSIIKIYAGEMIQDAARLLLDHEIGGLPVFSSEEELVGIITAEEIISGYVQEDQRPKMTPEAAAIYLSMTRSREYEKYWLNKVKGYNFMAAITQAGSHAEKLPIKLRESTTVAAIAREVIRETSREKLAVSNAVKDAFLQLSLINPGLGGGFKISIVRGEGRLVVAIFGKFGHALVDGPEQLALGISII